MPKKFNTSSHSGLFACSQFWPQRSILLLLHHATFSDNRFVLSMCRGHPYDCITLATKMPFNKNCKHVLQLMDYGTLLEMLSWASENNFPKGKHRNHSPQTTPAKSMVGKHTSLDNFSRSFTTALIHTKTSHFS